MSDTLRIACWFGLGVLTGAGHAAGLWRAARRTGRPALSDLARLALVAAILIAAALAGGLLPAASGWGSGLAVSSLIIYRRTAP